METLFGKLESSFLVRTIRNGLLMTIPILMIGSFALIFNNLPIEGYRNFIASVANGALVDFFVFVNQGTFGLLSIYMVFCLSLSFAREHTHTVRFIYGVPLTSLICFVILSGISSENFDISFFGSRGVFTAIFCALIGSALYIQFSKWSSKRKRRLWAEGADVEFNNAISVIIPMVGVTVIFAVFNLLLVDIFNVSGLQELFIRSTDALFHGIDNGFWSGLLYVFLSSLLWFFGVHGSDVLETVSQSLFVPVASQNAANIAAGLEATEIVSKSFMDIFVFMGGCGTSLALILALLIFSKRRANRSLSRMAALPVLFNINELLIFGLPVILNPLFIFPFILTPVVSYLLAYGATAIGLMPVIAEEIHWTTPFILGGWTASGSLVGAIVQLVTIAIGIVIYLPFVRRYDDYIVKNSIRGVSKLAEVLRDSEENNTPITLTQLRSSRGALAKTLAADLQNAINKQELTMFYQPQFDNHDKCTGVEALLRWKHHQVGYIYPPLIIKLADEADMLETMERQIILMVAKDRQRIGEILGDDVKVSVNVSGKTIQSESFANYLQKLISSGMADKGSLWLEITEQMAFLTSHNEEVFSRIRSLGYPMAIDDFSMGHTSIKYLQNNHFDMVKLDGSLVTNLTDNDRAREIVASIVYLSRSLGFDVLAEFVETREQQKTLEDIGCYKYQGYLYSPAVPLEELANIRFKDKAKIS